MKTLLALLLFFSTTVFANNFKTENEALDFCLKIHDKKNTPEQIKQIIKKSMRYLIGKKYSLIINPYL